MPFCVGKILLVTRVTGVVQLSLGVPWGRAIGFRLTCETRIKSSSAAAQDSATRIPQLFCWILQLRFRNFVDFSTVRAATTGHPKHPSKSKNAGGGCAGWEGDSCKRVNCKPDHDVFSFPQQPQAQSVQPTASQPLAWPSAAGALQPRRISQLRRPQLHTFFQFSTTKVKNTYTNLYITQMHQQIERNKERKEGRKVHARFLPSDRATNERARA